jgi:hypothetical protein
MTNNGFGAGTDFPRHLLQGVLLSTAYDDLCTFTNKYLRNRFSDAATGACHNRDLILENIHASLFFNLVRIGYGKEDTTGNRYFLVMRSG